ncbi:tetratricopeptide repeat protein [Pseudomonas sp. GOM7]|uniref:tetratricopeptide repeat protein n=1 Tax=unclassified Pseudomonas TaxID=196821 RepID=UPI00227A5D4C|nr:MULTISPECIES: tetratricopeptide repeat protein [unclassified Pseudomonas]WAJ39066.1 tetratricopeptide repeat protein [Pseudomonas sp. GOM7]
MLLIRPLFLVMATTLLSACAPTTPLFIAQVTTNEVVEYKALKAKRMSAAIEEEGDLLTYSAMAIRDAHSDKAEALYLDGYRDQQLSDEVRAIALYQIGLIYMNSFNDQRDDAKALNYFYKVVNEFPNSRAASRAEKRIAMIRKRAEEPVHKSSRELLEHWQPSQNLDLYKPSLDQDMTLLSRRAVLKDRVAEAEELYLLGLADPHIAADIKEKALYQLALMYMAPDNPSADREKAIAYLRRLLAEYPNGELHAKASLLLDKAINLNTP